MIVRLKIGLTTKWLSLLIFNVLVKLQIQKQPVANLNDRFKYLKIAYS